MIEAHGARKEPGATFIRQQRKLARRVAKLRGLRRNAKIAGERKGQAAGDSGTMDHRDKGLIAIMQRQHDLVHADAHLMRVTELVATIIGPVRIFAADIAAGTKATAGASDDEATQIVAFDVFRERRHQIAAHLTGVGVEVRRAVECDPRNTWLRHIEKNVAIFVGHGAFPACGGAGIWEHGRRTLCNVVEEPMSEYSEILYEVQERIATITLNRPERLNAYTGKMASSIKRAMAEANNDPQVRVIIITGSGRGFCAGADMDILSGHTRSEPNSPPRRDPSEIDSRFHSPLGPNLDNEFHDAERFGYFVKAKKPIIAAINGPIAGIGLVMALYADIRFAAANAVFTTSFSQRGLIAEHGMSLLLPLIVAQPNSF